MLINYFFNTEKNFQCYLPNIFYFFATNTHWIMDIHEIISLEDASKFILFC